jgi:hypothetical protein
VEQEGVKNNYDTDIQKNIFAALSAGNGRKMPIPSLPPCELNFLSFNHFPGYGMASFIPAGEG